MKRALLASIALAFAALAAAQPMQEKMRTVERELGSDRFSAGCPLHIVQPVAGDLLAASCDLEVGSAVSGDAALAGGSVRLDANVGGACTRPAARSP